MNLQPRDKAEYDDRQIEAARRVLIDVSQVLASFQDCLVLVGGWVPDMLLSDAGESHIGSIDVDLALSVNQLIDGRYAELLLSLLTTRRYRLGEKPFQMVATVDLGDQEVPVEVQVDFMAPKRSKLQKNNPKLIKGFGVLEADACGTAFRSPTLVTINGQIMAVSYSD